MRVKYIDLQYQIQKICINLTIHVAQPSTYKS